MNRKISFSFRNLLAAGTAVAVLAVPVGTVAAQTATAPKPAPVQAISAKDKAEGAKAHEQLVPEFGGKVTGAQALYVEGVGKRIATHSGLSNAQGDFTVTLLNSPVNNAFAIPGGYIYTTRQLVALMNNEAELAGVLGHEVAHVAARHSAKRQKAATKNAIIGVLGTVLSGVLLGNSQIGQMLQQGFMQGSQMLTLRYSRAQETESDKLGIQYLKSAGYDPRAMSTVLQSLANQNALDARLMGANGDRVPEWASTHPEPGKRVAAALAMAGGATGGTTNRDLFLSKIAGLTYGDDPVQGIVEGNEFTHPVEMFYFHAPSGFFLLNGTRAVAINGQGGKGQLTGAPYSGDLDAYVRAGFAALTGKDSPALNPGNVTRTTVNGLTAAYATARVAQSNNSQVDVTVFAYEFAKDKAFHFVTISPAGGGAQWDSMYGSMRRITQAEASKVKPRKLVVVTAKAGDTVQSLASKMAYTNAQLERFQVLNGLSSTSKIAAGQKVKLVTY
jgi:predicted Zn-dependent protease